MLGRKSFRPPNCSTGSVRAPEHFSPNVLLRPVVQDYLLPTLAYTGGAAEAAYFAQAGAVYEELLGRVTPIVPRFSATLVEPKVQRWLEHYGISVPDTFQGPEALRSNLQRARCPRICRLHSSERTNQWRNLSPAKETLAKLDPTLVEASQNGASKIQYQLDRLRERAMAAERRRSELVTRHAEALSQALYPDERLQERGIASIYFVARLWNGTAANLHEALRTDCHDHQILEL